MLHWFKFPAMSWGTMMRLSLLSYSTFLTLPFVFSPVQASNQLAGGVWFNYNQSLHSGASEPNNGTIGDEALVLYADGQAEKGQGNWSYSAEWRMGPGSFTDPDNNSTGDQAGMHKAWVGFDFNESYKLIVGKSQVPFGWKTYNFWPGDMLQGGYGDQMDVGLKLQGQRSKLHYDIAYFHQDDWGKTSTDTMDDNGHWGGWAPSGSLSSSLSTYRKVQTWVANADIDLTTNHTVGVSLQAGRLHEFTKTDDGKVNGDHSAAVIYYKGTFGNTFVNGEVIQTQRNLPENYASANGLERKVENTRYAFEVGRSSGNWTYYLDANWADPKTKGNNASLVSAYAPGIKYNYGPGWIYAEYLTQDGYIGRNGNVGEGDFSALYLTMDFYF